MPCETQVNPLTLQLQSRKEEQLITAELRPVHPDKNLEASARFLDPDGRIAAAAERLDKLLSRTDHPLREAVGEASTRSR